MKVFIAADIEGATGVVTWGQAGSPSSSCYDWPFARRMMTHDVNAAIRGARRAGATEIVVKDSHNTGKNLLIDELEEGVELISGSGSGDMGMVSGLDSTFACVMLVGYHAMAGTPHSVMEHTYTGGVHHLTINGQPSGEIAVSAYSAACVGVPVVMISSDAGGCQEAASLIPGVATAEVKRGLGRYMGRLKHPSATGPLIEAAAEQGMAKRAALALPKPPQPVAVRLEQNRSEEADAIAMLPCFTRTSGYACDAVFEDWPTAHKWLIRAMLTAASAYRSGE